MNLTDINKVDLGNKSRKRVGRGRGSGHGKRSTRGQKGQKQRKGYSMRTVFEGGQTPMFKRFPKHGFSNVQFMTRFTVVNVGDLNEIEGLDIVSAETLVDKGVIRKMEKAGLKVLGDGEVTRAMTVKANKFSKSAVQKIEAAGGKVEVV